MQKEHVFNTVFNTLITEAALNVLSDARDNMVNSLTMNLMNQNGKVTLEESEFFGRIVDKVIMEATSDFIPEEVDVPDEDSQEPVELWDAAGNKYVFQDGQLYNAGEDDMDGDVDPAATADVDAPADIDPAATADAVDAAAPADADMPADVDPADAASVTADTDGDGDTEGDEDGDEDIEEEMEESTKISKNLENIEESTLNSHDAVRNIMNKLIR